MTRRIDTAPMPTSSARLRGICWRRAESAGPLARLKMRILAGGPADAHAVDAGRQQELDQVVECGFVEPTVARSRRDDCREESFHAGKRISGLTVLSLIANR